MLSIFLSQPEVTVPGGYARVHETLASVFADDAVTVEQRAAVFQCVASRLGSIAYGERGPTLFAPTAFDRTSKENGGKRPLLWSHDATQPIGSAWLRVERNVGLIATGTLAGQVQRAREAAELLRMGSLNGISIGFSPDPDSISWTNVGGQNVRVIGETRVDEVSLCVFPADPAARVIEVHALAFPVETTVDTLVEVWRERGGDDSDLWREIQRRERARREAQPNPYVHPLARFGTGCNGAW